MNQEELEKDVDNLNICIYRIIVQVNQEELEKVIDKMYLYLLYYCPGEPGGAGEGCR